MEKKAISLASTEEAYIPPEEIGETPPDSRGCKCRLSAWAAAVTLAAQTFSLASPGCAVATASRVRRVETVERVRCILDVAVAV